MTACRPLAALFAVALAGCAATPEAPNPAYGTPRAGVLTGSVNWLARAPLPPEAVLSVRLADVGAEPAQTVAERRLNRLPGTSPLRFELPYEPKQVFADRRYAVQARISAGERVLYANALPYPVLTRGAPEHVDMVVDAVTR